MGFLAEGLPTLALAPLCPFVLPDAPADAEWLTLPEREWIESTLRAEREAAGGHDLPMMRCDYQLATVDADRHSTADRFRRLQQGLFPPLILKTFGFGNRAIGYWTAMPALTGILGMILFSQSSDRTGERVWHLMVPLLIGGLALMFAGSSIGTNPPLTIAAFALAASGISGSLPVFRNLPTAFLGASAAAGGIAFINSVGNVSGYAAPQLVGVLHDIAGSYRMPMLMMGAMVTVAGILVPVATRLRPATVAIAQQI